MILLNVEQVCQMLQVKKSYLYHLTHLNMIPFIKIGHHLRFDKSDLEKWLIDMKNGGDNYGDIQG